MLGSALSLQTPKRRHPFGSSAIVGSFVASDARVAEESEDLALRPRLSPGLPLSTATLRYRHADQVSNLGLLRGATYWWPLLGAAR